MLFLNVILCMSLIVTQFPIHLYHTRCTSTVRKVWYDMVRGLYSVCALNTRYYTLLFTWYNTGTCVDIIVKSLYWLANRITFYIEVYTKANRGPSMYNDALPVHYNDYCMLRQRNGRTLWTCFKFKTVVCRCLFVRRSPNDDHVLVIPLRCRSWIDSCESQHVCFVQICQM